MEHIRCHWCNLKNPVYIRYHDEEWGIPQHDDRQLFELLILETFQAGLSWETVLNKRDNFRRSFDEWDPKTICRYSGEKIQALMSEPGIIRNRRKIEATIQNARVFLEIQQQYGSFDAYIWHFTNGATIVETDRSCSELSDFISSDLKKLGMRFVGTTVVYSYLQAIGVIYSHGPECFLYRTT